MTPNFRYYTSLKRAEKLANSQLPEDEKFTVTPHVLRHTFLRWLAETKGIQYAMKASGHKTDRYIWCYVEPKEESLAEAVEDME